MPCFAGLTFPSQKKREKTQIIFGFIEVEGKENERENRPDRKEGEGEEGEVSPRQEGMGARIGLIKAPGWAHDHTEVGWLKTMFVTRMGWIVEERLIGSWCGAA